MKRNKIWIACILAIVMILPAAAQTEDTTAYGYSVEKTLTKPISQSKTSSSNSFAATLDYSDADVYTGTLSKDGSSFVKSGTYIPGNPGIYHVHDSTCFYSKYLTGVYQCNNCGAYYFNPYWANFLGRRFSPKDSDSGFCSALGCSNYYGCAYCKLEFMDSLEEIRDSRYQTVANPVENWKDRYGQTTNSVSEACKVAIWAWDDWTQGQHRQFGSQNDLVDPIWVNGAGIYVGHIKAEIDTRIWQQNYIGTATKTVTEYPKLQSIEILQMPDRVNYQVEEDFDTKGMIVQATYEDGHQEIIEMKNREGEGIS